jgi:hypothetical protein
MPPMAMAVTIQLPSFLQVFVLSVAVGSHWPPTPKRKEGLGVL